MSSERGDDISGHMGNALCFHQRPVVGGGYLRAPELARAAATLKSALALDLGKSSELVPFFAAHLQ